MRGTDAWPQPAAAHELEESTVLDFGSLGSITLTGVTLASITADDFVFG